MAFELQGHLPLHVEELEGKPNSHPFIHYLYWRNQIPVFFGNIVNLNYFSPYSLMAAAIHSPSVYHLYILPQRRFMWGPVANPAPFSPYSSCMLGAGWHRCLEGYSYIVLWVGDLCHSLGYRFFVLLFNPWVVFIDLLYCLGFWHLECQFLFLTII